MIGQGRSPAILSSSLLPTSPGMRVSADRSSVRRRLRVLAPSQAAPCVIHSIVFALCGCVPPVGAAAPFLQFCSAWPTQAVPISGSGDGLRAVRRIPLARPRPSILGLYRADAFRGEEFGPVALLAIRKFSLPSFGRIDREGGVRPCWEGRDAGAGGPEEGECCDSESGCGMGSSGLGGGGNPSPPGRREAKKG